MGGDRLQRRSRDAAGPCDHVWRPPSAYAAALVATPPLWTALVRGGDPSRRRAAGRGVAGGELPRVSPPSGRGGGAGGISELRVSAGTTPLRVRGTDPYQEALGLHAS